MESSDNSPFSNRVRLRVCGVLIEDGQMLLVRHNGLGPLGYFWSPPGGGLDFGETVEEGLKREFREETHLSVKPGPFLMFHEHIDHQFHALELFFVVERISGIPSLGQDPEMGVGEAMMVELRSFSPEELKSLPDDAYHSCIPGFFRNAGILF